MDLQVLQARLGPVGAVAEPRSEAEVPRCHRAGSVMEVEMEMEMEMEVEMEVEMEMEVEGAHPVQGFIPCS